MPSTQRVYDTVAGAVSQSFLEEVRRYADGYKVRRDTQGGGEGPAE